MCHAILELHYPRVASRVFADTERCQFVLVESVHSLYTIQAIRQELIGGMTGALFVAALADQAPFVAANDADVVLM